MRRAIARLSDRAGALRDEIGQLEVELDVVAADADQSSIDAVVRPAAPVQREAGRARASRDGLRRLLEDRRSRLAAVLADRDALLEQMTMQGDTNRD